MYTVDRMQLLAMARSTAVGRTGATRFLLVASLLTLLGMLSCEGDSELRAKEQVLRNVLFLLREQIDNYTTDKNKAPQSLQDLVTAGYLKKIPMDPFTGSERTWITVTEIAAGNNQERETGITDVHSASKAIGTDGRPYSDW